MSVFCRDEGYIDKDNILHHNIHAHFLVHNYNFETKKAILSNFRKKDYRQLQTLAQKSFNSVGLDFKRGLSKFQTKLNHQKRNDFILHKQNQELKILQKDLLQKNQEIKELYTLLNSQKNQLKELRLQFEKDSNIYKMLSLNIKNLSLEEQTKREEFRQLDSKIKELKNQVQREEVLSVFKEAPGVSSLDYIACWFFKAALYIKNYNAECAFVSTNSITQGEQVSLFWPHIFNINICIGFCHQVFKWQNNAKNNAVVAVVIIGLRNDYTNKRKYIYKDLVKKKSSFLIK